MQPMFLCYATREQLREQLVGFNAVIERVDQPRKRRLTSGPVVERGQDEDASARFLTRVMGARGESLCSPDELAMGRWRGMRVFDRSKHAQAVIHALGKEASYGHSDHAP